MSVIMEDEISLYINCYGWIIRPVCKTIFSPGQEVKTYKFEANTVGVGKLHGSKRKVYQEYWVTCVMAREYNYIAIKEQREQFEYNIRMNKPFIQFRVDNQ